MNASAMTDRHIALLRKLVEELRSKRTELPPARHSGSYEADNRRRPK